MKNKKNPSLELQLQLQDPAFIFLLVLAACGWC